MNKQQKITFFVLILLGLIYFAIFIPANLTGAKDVNMLSAFEHDEFAQYPHVLHMLEKGTTPYLTLRNFLIYSHYYYGYPFYFFSALFLFPVKWILGSEWTTQTQTIVGVLRQTINILPMILSVFLMIFAQIRSKFPWKALISFLLLLSLPAVIGNNLWWHPDSLLTLFSVMTIIFLILDDGRFGRFFYLSGVACALSIGAKLLGVLFVLAYASYLLYGLISRKLSWRKITLSAVLFLVVLFASVIISNPLLALPIERGEIIATFKANLAQSSTGFWVVGNGMTDKLDEITNLINEYYGGVVLFIAALITTMIGLIQNKHRLKYLVIFTWVFGYMGYFVFFASTFRPHYFIPAIVPLYSTLLDLIPDSPWSFWRKTEGNRKKKVIARIASLLLIGLILVDLGGNIQRYVGSIKQAVHREETSGSLALYQTFESQFVPTIPQDTPLIIYRDWRAYVAEKPHWNIIYDWNLANYEYIDENKPDILFIEMDNALYFSDDSKLAAAIDVNLMVRMNRFYSDVLDEDVTGYHLLYKDSFGYIFVSDQMFTDYFK